MVDRDVVTCMFLCESDHGVGVDKVGSDRLERCVVYLILNSMELKGRCT